MAASAFDVWNRASVVTVGTYQIANIGQQLGLDVWFEVRRSLKSGKPNTCDLRLYNLAPDTRAQIENYTQPIQGTNTTTTPGSVVPVTIVAGYVGKMGLIFSGSLRTAQTLADGADYVTELNSGDGDASVVLARTSYSFPRGANAYVVAMQLLSDMAKAANVTSMAGNTATVANILKGSPLYSLGVTLKGSSYDHLQDLALSCGLEVTIQKGVAQWSSLGQPVPGEQYSLSASTGMYGSPTRDTKGLVSVETALIPDIVPGCNVQVSGQFVSGWFRATDVETTGSTFGAEWGHKMTCKDFGLAP